MSFVLPFSGLIDAIKMVSVRCPKLALALFASESTPNIATEIGCLFATFFDHLSMTAYGPWNHESHDLSALL